MSNRSGRSWYRLSSIVRPTPYSSRDPSPPRHVINPPPYPPSQPLPPSSPRSPPKEVPSLVPLSLSTKHDHETTHPKNILTPPHSPRDPPPSRHVTSQPPSPLPQPLPPPSPSSQPKEANTSLLPLSRSTKHDPAKPEHKHETILTPPHSSRDSSPPRHVINPPPSPPPQPLLPPPSPRSPPKETKEANTSPVPLSRSTKHDPLKPRSPPQETKEANPSLVPLSRSTKRDPLNPRSPPKETKEDNPSLVPLSLSTKHDPPKPGHKHETIHLARLNIRPDNDQQEDSNISSTYFHDEILNTGHVIITISGENKGAVMEIIWSSCKTRGSGKVPRLKSSSDDEGNESNSKSKKQSNNDDNLTMDGFVNSNVQMINSSVVYSSTGTHYDPGVHLSLYRKPSSGDGFIAKDHGNGYTSSIN